MASAPSLASFARATLEARGALVEQRGDRLHALLPPALRAAYDLPEELVMREVGALAPSDPVPGQATLSLDSPLLGVLARMAQGDGRIAALGLTGAVGEAQHLQREAAERFAVRGLTLRSEPPRSGFGSYCRASYAWEVGGGLRGRGRVDVLLSEDSLLEPPGLLVATTAWNLAWKEPSAPPGPPRSAAALLAAAEAAARARVHELLAAERATLAERVSEEDERIRDYSASLEEEVHTTIARRNLSEEEVARRKEALAEQVQGLSALRRSLLAAQQPRARLRLLGLLRLRLPVAHIILGLRRGRSERTLSVTWSALTQSWEPIACEGCHEACFSTSLCGSAAHLLCSKCAAAEGRAGCPAC